ncbi:MAG: histidine phosphatase family protein [Phycisphaeraceae bacterium]
MKDVYLIRHGQAQSGPSGMDRDFFLTDQGQGQAHELGQQLSKAGILVDRIYASRLTRARQTAQILAQHVPAPLTVRDDLIEHGSAVFLLEIDLIEAARRRPAALAPDGALRVEPGSGAELNWDYSVGGETLRALHGRAIKAFHEIEQAHHGSPDRIAIVAHGSILSAMLSEVLGLAPATVWRFQFACAAVFHLRYCEEEGQRTPVLCIHGPGGAFPQTNDRSEKIQTPAAGQGNA